MTVNYKRTRQYLEAFDFKRLFAEELGWGLPKGNPATIEVDGVAYGLTPVAESGGMIVFTCVARDAQVIDVPVASRRQKIDKEVSKIASEHIIIFVNAARTAATWQWFKHGLAEPARARQHSYSKGQPGDSLLQKLAGIAFSIDDLDADGQMSITKVSAAVKKAFDVERVTKRFYDAFKSEHDAFMKLLAGIEDATERAWYTSVILNRLMFIYFIQKKNFLDGDPDYLRNQLKAMPKRDRFYRDFLVPLFFEGFAKEERERSPETSKLLGKIPYLNGGLFQPHQLEQAHGKHLDIPDKVFEQLFKFFDEYTWYLDDRPMHADNEINPDVLGYIFEKYINQKQMGAYYTKEDITGYICRNTILPFLFDKLVRERYGKLDELPMDDVEPYIYPAVKQKEYLPTETEREYAARQKRLAQIRADFKAGKIASINDLITYNLDSERFMRDWLRGLKDPATLQTFYFECLSKLTVLDPTVGSGAFLFAVMNILESLYEIALDRMEALAGPKYPKFKEELARVALHTNRRHFVYKSIIINNLFGVDIMEEATEICKLRLFLKLVAQVDDVNRIEPLPDIDFNIRAGNTLVGYASLDEVEQAGTRSLFNMNLPQKIKEADIALRSFRALQTQQNISASMLTKAKADARTQLAEIEKALNESLSAEYGARSLAKFVESHKPFHWYVEFNQIMQDGGFDVIVGNPPYVEYKDVRNEYQVRGYETESCGDLYAYVTERTYTLLRLQGRVGLIIPISIFGTDGFESLQKLSLNRLGAFWVSFFANRPSQLFDGAQKRLSILVGRHDYSQAPRIHTTAYMRWRREEWDDLFATRVTYLERSSAFYVFSTSLEKLGSANELSVFSKLISKKSGLADCIVNASRYRVYYTRKFGYFLAFLDFIPKIVDTRTRRKQLPSELKELGFKSDESARIAVAALSSSTFFWFWNVLSDCRNLNRRDLLAFPFNTERLPLPVSNSLSDLGRKYLDALQETSRTMRKGGLELQTFAYASCKPIIDEIDRVLATYYGFTDEELDFIINYDIKYRMGRESESLNE
jgi:hypothetical protein